MFGELTAAEPVGDTAEDPDWLDDARRALVAPGGYIAYEDDDRVRVVALQDGWTRVGRSLSAHIRFDDPTVSRRHALIHSHDGSARLLDDRSLNGVVVNGARVDMRELEDGDSVGVGRFVLHYICLGAEAVSERPERVHLRAV